MMEISIIVPVYNTGKYVGKCVESLLAQTLSEIEIICIDDASTDNSLEVIESYAKKDERIQIIRHLKNQGTLQARKHGVANASGNYIMFVDSDDWLETIACEQLYHYIKQEKVDILQFGTNIIPAVPLSESMILWVEDFLKPYEYRLEGRSIIRACFVENKFDFNITDKIWNANLCKKAFSLIGDERMITAEDSYAFFVLTYYAKSYIGIGKAKYYNYNVGIGVTGSDSLDLDRFEKRCKGEQAVQAVKRFLKQCGTVNDFEQEYKKFENRLLRDSVDCWYNKLRLEDCGKGYDFLLKYWGVERVVSAIAGMYFEKQRDVIRRIQSSEKVPKWGTVGIYYRYFGYKPRMPFIQGQVKMIEDSGGHACIFSDADAPVVEWPMANSEVVILPSSENANWDQYESRAIAFAEELRLRKISIMLYASPTSHIAWLDELLIRSLGISVLYLEEADMISRENYVQNLELKVRRQEEELTLSEEKIKQYKEELQQSAARIGELKASRTYRLGWAFLWLPRKLKSIFLKQDK